MYIAPDGSLGIGDPDAITFASHGITSVARNIPNGPSLRGTLPPKQLTNSVLWMMREGWVEYTTAERIHYVHQMLNSLRDPVESFDPEIWGDLTLAEMHHARKVLTRLLPFLIGAANAESTGPHQGFTTVNPTEGPII